MAGCGQHSLSRLKYATLSSFLLLKTFEKGLLNMLVSAVGFMEGYDPDSSPSIDLFDRAESRSLFLVPYVTNMGLVEKERSIQLDQQKKTIVSLDKEKPPPVPMFISSVTVKKDAISPSVKVDNSFIKNFIPQGTFPKEELAYNILRTTLPSYVTLHVVTLLLASGITIPREVAVDLLHRLANDDKETACNVASLLEVELDLTECSAFKNLFPSRRRKPPQSIVCHEKFNKIGVQDKIALVPQKGNTNTMRLSRLQHVRKKKQ
ncbi:peptidyl-prolyl cis-trans isomerase [Trypanosoma theileri]|uniref:Peptidyl-prolyl cis-trans isomerase n=1 Tax=Trypanosoma theileri TaxID=67003 RepID=A0A1X0NX71_9TRYP|nr:peptidyl-prolyl cis-trans isomerase [Trypanosoma theileri]ORC89063.1 peptidyl-prolyl cis-trans isomerase [Trypanosoma theileri]